MGYGRPPFGAEPNRALCDLCHEIVMRPVIYRGGKYHKHCALKLWRQDISTEICEPRAEEAERIVSEIVDSNPEELT